MVICSPAGPFNIIWSGLFRRICVPSIRRIRELFESLRGSEVCGCEFLTVGLLGVAEGPAGVPGVATSGKEGIGFGGLLLLLGASSREAKVKTRLLPTTEELALAAGDMWTRVGRRESHWLECCTFLSISC